MKVEAKLPFDFCERCNFRELEEERFYCLNSLQMNYLICVNSQKCQNAVELYQRHDEQKGGDSDG